ncbi:MAG: phosphoribosyl-AMP cyclohydrolase [Candidatus Omnitrophica bacterium]|nr:phosphoribosyl-AMP cyclohydrolase [Candidatus Omnitrophota bacterium]
MQNKLRIIQVKKGLKSFLKELKFDEKGLIPAVIQDFKTGEVLMVAYMNRSSLSKTIEAGKTHFWSRSRNKLWLKGETSGNFQIVKKIFYDCDGDCLLFKIKQVGGVACHTGNRSCFFREFKPKVKEQK